jgi:hypothetical protein
MFDPHPTPPKMQDTGDYGHHRGAHEANSGAMRKYLDEVKAWEERNGKEERDSSQDYDP